MLINNNKIDFILDSFCIRGHTIIPIFDYVHLIKGVRNNLLTKDLWTNTNKKPNEEKKYACWDDIITAYEIDKFSFLRLRQMPKLTEKHVYPNAIPKMRVKYATQILSNTVSNFIDVILNLSRGKIIFKDCETVYVIYKNMVFGYTFYNLIIF